MHAVIDCSLLCLNIPQESVISLTFNVHTNDLEESVISTCKYADDCTQDKEVDEGLWSYMQEVIDAA